MSDISMDKKLELVHQIRSQYHQNQSDLLNREQILYKKTEPESLPDIPSYTMKLRFAVAAVLFLTVILLDQSGQCLGGLNAQQIFEMIATDYEAEMLHIISQP